MDRAATWSTLSFDHHGVTSWHRLAKLGGQRSGPSHQPSASLALCVLWAEEATRSRWYLGLRDGRPWGVRPIFGGGQRQPWLPLAPQQQVDTGDQVLELLLGSIPELLVGEQLLVLG